MVRARLAIGAILAIGLLAATSSDAATTPTMTLVKTRPLQVSASGFQPRETVRLTVRAASRVTRSTATADRDGHFAVTVRDAVVSRCAALLISASGSDGSHTTLRRVPQCPARGG